MLPAAEAQASGPPPAYSTPEQRLAKRQSAAPPAAVLSAAGPAEASVAAQPTPASGLELEVEPVHPALRTRPGGYAQVRADALDPGERIATGPAGRGGLPPIHPARRPARPGGSRGKRPAMGGLVLGGVWLVASLALGLWVLRPELFAFLDGSEPSLPAPVAATPAPQPVAPAEQARPEGSRRALSAEDALQQVQQMQQQDDVTRLQAKRDERMRGQIDGPNRRMDQQVMEAERDRERKAMVRADIERQSQSAAARNVKITMYKADWCKVCKQAAAYMDSKGIAYQARDIDDSDEAREQCRVLNPRLSIPTITIDNQLLVGFSPDSLMEHIDRAVAARQGRR